MLMYTSFQKKNEKIVLNFSILYKTNIKISIQKSNGKIIFNFNTLHHNNDKLDIKL